MMIRQAQPFPSGVSTITFPKRGMAYRVAMVSCTMFAGVTSKQCSLQIADGANNTIAIWPSFLVTAGFTMSLTFAAGGNTDSSNNFALPSGSLLMVAIPTDLWIQPQWTLRLSLNPNDASDTLTNTMLTIDVPELKEKPLARGSERGQDAPP